MKHYPRVPNGRLKELANKFEKNTSAKNPTNFNQSEILLLADFYEYEKLPYKSIEVLDFGLNLYQDSSELLIRKTRILLYNFNSQKAIQSIDQTANSLLDSSQIDLLRLEILIVQKKFDQALSIISSLKFRYNKSSKVLSDLFYFESVVFEKIQKFNLSFDALTEALWINPRHNEAKGKIWISTELSKKYKESIALNYFLLQKDYYSAITWFNLGHAYYSAGQYKKAIEAFEFCKIINEDFVSAYLDIAEVSMILGLFKKAVDNLKIVVDKFEINEMEVLIQYGESLFRLGESRLARETFQKAMLIDPLDPDLLFLIGETFRVENNFDEAIYNYELALEVDDERDDVYRNLARINFLKMDFENAKTYFEKAIGLDPANPNYRIELASFFLNIGENWNAELVLSEARNELKCVQLDYYYGAILLILKKEKLGLKVIEEALKTDFGWHEEIYEFAPELIDHPKLIALINYYRGEN